MSLPDFMYRRIRTTTMAPGRNSRNTIRGFTSTAIIHDGIGHPS